jgi:hypothetical protein
MALGINYESGDGHDIVPVIKYDARGGKLLRIDRENNDNVPTDVSTGFSAVFDFENMEVGHIYFQSAAAPDFCVAPYGTQAPPAPSPNHKPGIRIIMKLGKASGGDIREMASTAKAFLRGLDTLHDAYLEGVKANPGKLPVVILTGTTPIVSEGKDANGKPQKSTNYMPNWGIKSWVDRPKDLVPMFKAPSSAAPAATGTPPSTGSTRMTAPAAAAAPAPAPAPVDDDDFG